MDDFVQETSDTSHRKLCKYAREFEEALKSPFKSLLMQIHASDTTDESGELSSLQPFSPILVFISANIDRVLSYSY